MEETEQTPYCWGQVIRCYLRSLCYLLLKTGPLRKICAPAKISPVSSTDSGFHRVQISDQRSVRSKFASVVPASAAGLFTSCGRVSERDNGNVHRAAANIIASKNRAARGFACNVLLCRVCPPGSSLSSMAERNSNYFFVSTLSGLGGLRVISRIRSLPYPLLTRQ